MSREIKFRAWDKENRTMHKVLELNFHQNGLDGVLEKRAGRFYFNKRTLVDGEYIDDVVLMQYTGFKAKGKEIYEGDILQITIDDEVEVMTDVGVVKMSSCGGWIVEDKYSKYIDCLWEWTTEDIKIIGNIYENKDLLEVKYE